MHPDIAPDIMLSKIQLGTALNTNRNNEINTKMNIPVAYSFKLELATFPNLFNWMIISGSMPHVKITAIRPWITIA
jgi:hypothetical protein